EEPLGERAPPGVVVDDAPLHMREPDALDPRRGALEIARLLAIELQERRRMLEHLVLGRDLAKEIGRPDLHAAVAADVQLVAGLDADASAVLDRRLRAVARAAGDRKLDLVRMPRAPRHPLETDAEAGRVLRAEAAPFLADAGFDRSERLAVSVPGHEASRAEIPPDRRQILLTNAEEIDALPAGQLHGRHAILLRDVRD